MPKGPTNYAESLVLVDGTLRLAVQEKDEPSLTESFHAADIKFHRVEAATGVAEIIFDADTSEEVLRKVIERYDSHTQPGG
jgi:hypothetical protein